MKITPKYEIGETVYLMCNNCIQHRKIGFITIYINSQGVQIKYEFDRHSNEYSWEKSLYKTAELLKESL